MPEPINIFFAYARVDQPLRDELDKQLAFLRRSQLIKGWYDGNISAGEEWQEAIDRHLHSADIILLLVSPDFIASDYCYDVEMRKALSRHEAGEAVVVPVILRPCHWQNTPFAKFQALPKNALAITVWPNRDQAFASAAKAIDQVVRQLHAKRNAPPPDPPPSPDVEPENQSAPLTAPALQSHDTVRMIGGSVVIGILALIAIGIFFRYSFLGSDAPATRLAATDEPEATSTTGDVPPTLTSVDTPTSFQTATSTIPNTSVPTFNSPTVTFTPLPSTQTPASTSSFPSPIPPLTSVIEPTGTDTATPTEIPSLSPSLTPTPLSSSIPTTPIVYPPPVLIEPSSTAESINGTTTFVWEWNGPELPETYGFEIRIWKEGEEHLGAHNALNDNILDNNIKRDNQNRYSFTFDPRSAAAVDSSDKKYLWTVAVVRLGINSEDYDRGVGQEAEPFEIEIIAKGSSGKNGSEDPTPTRASG